MTQMMVLTMRVPELGSDVMAAGYFNVDQWKVSTEIYPAGFFPMQFRTPATADFTA